MLYITNLFFRDACETEKSVDKLATTFYEKVTINSLEPIKQFVGYHMYVLSESDTFRENPTDYEMQLYADYVNREGEQAILHHERQNKNKKDSTKESGEKYEKALLKHGDRGFHRFQKRIKNCPDQCLRYLPLFLEDFESEVTR